MTIILGDKGIKIIPYAETFYYDISKFIEF